MATIDFWFDFLSPYAFLAWRRAPGQLPGVVLRPRPVLLGAILAHFGQLGPAEIPAKRAFTIRDTLRRASDAGIPMSWPVRHPFRPILAARVAWASDCDPQVISALFDAAWVDGRDLEDSAVVADALHRAGLDAGLVDRAKQASDRLRAETEAAIARGVFGVPMFEVEGELFFGDDQLPRVAAVLAGEDRLDHALAKAIEARPIAVSRPRT